MKKTFAILCLAACLSAPAALAQDPSKKSTEELVKAAQDAKSKRKTSSTKVITNKDVKKTKGKIVVLKPSEKPADKVETTSSLAKQNADFHDRVKATERLDLAQKKVDGLEKELTQIEQRYYEENDPSYRDTVLQQRFNQTKRQLEEARHELADARDGVDKLTPQVTTKTQ